MPTPLELIALQDGFFASTRDAAKWNDGLITRGNNDVNITKTFGVGEVRLSGPASAAMGGLSSQSTFNFTNKMAFFRVGDISSEYQFNFVFGSGTENQNWVRLEWYETGFSIIRRIGGGSGVSSAWVSVTDNPWLRTAYIGLGHRQADDLFVAYASADGVTWEELTTLPRSTLDITVMRLELQFDPYIDNAYFSVQGVNTLMPRALPAVTQWSAPLQAVNHGAGIWPDDVSNEWDYILWGAAGVTSVVRYGGQWYLYYVGAKGYLDDPEYTPTHRRVGVATSSDGFAWTKHPSNPLFTFAPNSHFEEGAVAMAVLPPDRTPDGLWHAFYSGNTYTGGTPAQVDMEIRHRTSTDGITWTDDALVYEVSGHEYQVIAAYHDGTNWHVYYLWIDGGPGSGGGRGPLYRIHGSTPTTLGTPTQVTTEIYASGQYTLYGGQLVFFLRTNQAGQHYHIRQIDATSLATMSTVRRAYEMATHYTNVPVFGVTEDAWYVYTLQLDDPIHEITVRAVGAEPATGQFASAVTVVSNTNNYERNTDSATSEAAILDALATAGDGVWVQSPLNPAETLLEVSLSTVQSADGRWLRYEHGKESDNPVQINQTVQLRSPDGVTLIREWVHTNVGLYPVLEEHNINDLVVDGQHRVRFIDTVV
jgi:hypothetical protein